MTPFLSSIHAQHFNFLSVTNILTHNNPHKIIYKQTEIAIDKLAAHAFFLYCDNFNFETVQWGVSKNEQL